MDTLKRFIEYVKIDTQADDDSTTFPSTQSQLVFGEKLYKECKEIGLSNVNKDKYGYVTATLPSNINKAVPVIAFIAHMDTSPDASGKNVNPIIIENYEGGVIERKGLPLSPIEFPVLKEYTGDTIVTSDGTTLLGADDKAGIAEIMSAMEFLINNPNIPHGEIKIAFTPDEEVGKGVDFFDVKSFGVDFGYTIDGSDLGELECENFNASRAKINITGKSVHPGYAKNIMINAGLVANEIISALPQNETPGTTEKYEGFYHLVSCASTVEKANLTFIIRDFEKSGLENRKIFINSIIENINKKYGNIATLNIHDEYENMYEIIKQNPHVFDLAKKAMEEDDIKPIIKPIRGGTDGARLSFMGLPCPNIFAGGINFHGPYEFIPLSSMNKAVQLIVKICELNANI